MKLPLLKYKESRVPIESIELKDFNLTSLNNELVLKEVSQEFKAGKAYRIQGALGADRVRHLALCGVARDYIAARAGYDGASTGAQERAGGAAAEA